jgi:uncharacterized membrane protein YphA (DoxX/SURF4 family)
MLTIHSIVEAWNSFFFTPESPLPLAVFRIAIGCSILLNSVLLYKDLPFWFGPDSVMPTEEWRKWFGVYKFSLFQLLPPTLNSVYIVYALNITASICLIIGFQTHVSALIVFLTVLSFHVRNDYIFSAADCVPKLMCFLLIFSPADQVLSLDCWSTLGAPD